MSGSLPQNWIEVRARVHQACLSANRDPSDVTIVAVTKRQSTIRVEEALAIGIEDVAENYVAEALLKQAELDDTKRDSVRWHLIGHLQRNKTKLAVQAFDLIQSVDSQALLSEIDRLAGDANKVQDILVQPKLGQDQTKTGAEWDTLDELLQSAIGMQNVRLLGLMGVPPLTESPTPYFRELRVRFDQMPLVNRRYLSIGMSGDFELAIAEGATMIRVGTVLFGQR